MRERRKTFVSNETRPARFIIATAVSPGSVSSATFQMAAQGLPVWILAQFRTSSFSAFFLTAAPTNATSLGVQRTVWGWNLLATAKVSESQQ